jgi:hypothetical protein
VFVALLYLAVDSAPIWKRNADQVDGNNGGAGVQKESMLNDKPFGFDGNINYTQLSAEESFKLRLQIFEEDLNRTIGEPWDSYESYTTGVPYKPYLPPEDEEEYDLRVFHAGQNSPDMPALCQWYGATQLEVDPETAMEQLRFECCNDTAEIDMCSAFDYAQLGYRNEVGVDGLSKAEMMTVTMYTGWFYRRYNAQVRLGNLDKYKVFTSLFFNALKKLDALYPVPVNTTLYRGMSIRVKTPESKRIHFKQFVSTSTERRIAENFGRSTFMIFEPPISIIAAPVQNLSHFPFEAEVLISPFEAFELTRREGNTMYFRSAKKQELLDNDLLSCTDLTSPHHPLNSGSAVLATVFVPYLLVAMVTSCHGY